MYKPSSINNNMLLMTASNLEGLECNWRIKETLSGEVQQDFQFIHCFSMAQKMADVVLDLRIALWVIMVL